MKYSLVIIAILVLVTVVKSFEMKRPIVNLERRLRSPVNSEKEIPVERRKLMGIFPKSTKRFVVSLSPVDKESKPEVKEIPLKRRLMKKMTFIDNQFEGRLSKISENRETTVMPAKISSKTPVMKGKFNFQRPSSSTKPPQPASEESFVKNIGIRKRENSVFVQPPSTIPSALIADDDDFQTTMEPSETVVNIRQKRSGFLVNDFDIQNEISDLEEYLFIDNEVNDQPIVISDNQQEEEINTEISFPMDSEYIKRSINIIEEENLVPTVSANKYTGKDTSLNSDNTFRNINY